LIKDHKQNIYCTIVQGKYAIRAMVLFESFKQYNTNNFIILSLDEESDNLLKKYRHDNLTILNYSKFSTENITALKNNRSTVEFCWTCKSYLISYIFTNYINIEWAIYIDSDSCIFGKLDKVLPNDTSYSVLLTPHRSTQIYFNSQIEKSGIFNAGFIGFKNDKNGVSVLNWWLNKCTSSCSSVVTSDVYGDQLYLNQIPILYKGIFECKHLGINAAPWNITDKLITKNNSSFFVNNDELLHFHFQGFEFINHFLFDIYKGNFKINGNIKKTIYKYYLKLFQYVLKNKVHNIAKFNFSDTNVNFKLFIIKFLKMLKGFNNIIIYYD
jgi:hypothetical protein